ncbi:MAG: sulfotransferase family protein [Gammaproteobacteria bacterium]|nr:sulfotransferase family protein [Gammaproteobacteria bacterium]
MALAIVGAGFGRTGTLSLKFALEKLGFEKCYHMMEVHQHPEHADVWSRAFRKERVDWDALFTGYRAAVDWPSCNWWREHAAYYPESKVILSTRDPDRWYESVRNTIYASTRDAMASADPAVRARGQWAHDLIWQGVFDGRMDDKAHVIAVLKRHEAAVKAAIPQHRLLVFEAASGWAPLCEFLGVDVPDVPYPRVNTTEDFLARTSVSARPAR